MKARHIAEVREFECVERERNNAQINPWGITAKRSKRTDGHTAAQRRRREIDKRGREERELKRRGSERASELLTRSSLANASERGARTSQREWERGEGKGYFLAFFLAS